MAAAAAAVATTSVAGVKRKAPSDGAATAATRGCIQAIQDLFGYRRAEAVAWLDGRELEKKDGPPTGNEWHWVRIVNRVDRAHNGHWGSMSCPFCDLTTEGRAISANITRVLVEQYGFDVDYALGSIQHRDCLVRVVIPFMSPSQLEDSKWLVGYYISRYDAPADITVSIIQKAVTRYLTAIEALDYAIRCANPTAVVALLERIDADNSDTGLVLTDAVVWLAYGQVDVGRTDVIPTRDDTGNDSRNSRVTRVARAVRAKVTQINASTRNRDEIRAALNNVLLRDLCDVVSVFVTRVIDV